MATQQRLPTGPSADYNAGVPTPGAGEANWEDVDDPIGSPDDATTNIYLLSGQRCAYTFAAFSIAATAVDKLSVTARRNQAVSRGGNAHIRVNAGWYSGTFAYGSGAYSEATDDWLTNPANGQAWTQNDINGSGGTYPLQEFGYYRAGGNGVTYLTQIYATVTYTEAAASFNPAWARSSNAIVK